MNSAEMRMKQKKKTNHTPSM